jgi:tetratricopeptide (TPR) repeat protein
MLFIGAPLVAIGMLIPAARYFRAEDFAAFLLAFFTFGHHLPGFLRAYGDRELFALYRPQFVLAPLVVFFTAFYCARHDLHGLLFVVFTWDIWHVLMQEYGFLRIYDAKAGRVDKIGAWADRAMALAWYLTFIAISPHYTHNLLLRAYAAGLPTLSVSALQAAQMSMLVASSAISLWYVWLQFRFWRSGARGGGNKLLALVCFLGATWYLYVIYPDFIVGFAVWSAFHCIQYYGIVWAFNRRRTEKASGLLRFLFRPRLSLVLLYLGLIFAYGGLNWAARYFPAGTGLQVLVAFIVTSGTLHYYFDGFIWRVRDQETRRGLSIDSATTAPALAHFRHPAVAQAAVAAMALVALVFLEMRVPYDEVRVRQAVANSAPALALAQRNYAGALRQAGQYAAASQVYATALQLNPHHAVGWHEYGLDLAALGRHSEAVSAFERALAEDPEQRAAHYNLASLLVRQGQTKRALQHYREAFPAGDMRALPEIERDPAAADTFTNLALGLLQAGNRKEALMLLQKVVTMHPRHASAQLNLGSLLVMMGDIAQARSHYQMALAGDDPAVRSAAAGALAKLR